jgi:hypothetical protein
MDKAFWTSLADNDYQIPDGYSLKELTKVLFSYLSSTDPELRDEIGYIVYANWLEREMYTAEEVRAHVQELLANLTKGIGEPESDSVFLRAFSILFLAEIVHNDNKKPLLDKDQIRQILEKGIGYLNAEKDPRGHIPVKGWAHALAHTADLLLELGRNRRIEQGDQDVILQAISNKLIHSTNWVYIHGEDDRLASAVIEILRRGLIPLEKVDSWATSFTTPDGQDWKGAYVNEERNRAFQNTRNFLRSIYLKLLSDQKEIPSHEPLNEVFFHALKNLSPY